MSSQAELYEILRANPNRWFTNRQLSEILGINKSSATILCQKMRKWHYPKLQFKSANMENRNMKVFYYRVKE